MKNQYSISRRRFIAAVAGQTALALSPNLFAGNKARPQRPNIVLVMADDQGWGDMGYYDHPVLKTPHLDSLAASALRFDRFYAAAPVCSPTRGSVMTGRHPNRFGCFKWGYSLRPQEITIAEALKKSGYATGHFGKWHIGPTLKNSPVSPGNSGFTEWLSAPNFFDNDPILSRRGVAVQMKGESSMVTADAAIEFIRKEAKRQAPFLAVVWFGSPHGPHRADEQDAKLYADQKKNLKNFYGEITGIDRAVGKLRNELQALDIRQNTVFWYCSDNGGLPGLGVTGGRKNKGSVYEGGLRVPAIMEWPARISKPRVTDTPCNTTDIYPTLLEITGAKVADQPPLDGVSLAPLIDGKMKTRRKPMGFWDYPARGKSTPSDRLMADLLKTQQAGKEITDPAALFSDADKITQQYPTDSFGGHSAWLDWPWKLHRIEDKAGKVKFELYNLDQDPQEGNNLINKNQKQAGIMKAELRNWLISVVNSLNGKDY